MRYFCPSAIFDYLGGQLGDKMGDNLQISKLKIKNLQKQTKINCLNKANYEQYLQIICFSLQKSLSHAESTFRCSMS